jgi:hypothetical protein
MTGFQNVKFIGGQDGQAGRTVKWQADRLAGWQETGW